ncbi:uncharacterized protein V1516DRAFT_684049 [Lipomyces oligophaga]|uniref:uncharacterized protein n=1 Tax=Lipomyces oligophaga TaxID=45792 RepID=UPI0034CF45CE
MPVSHAATAPDTGSAVHSSLRPSALPPHVSRHELNHRHHYHRPRQQPFSTLNLILQVCIVNPLCSLRNFFVLLCLLCLHVLTFANRPSPSLDLPLSEKPARLSSNEEIYYLDTVTTSSGSVSRPLSCRALLTHKLALLAVAHLRRSRLRLVPAGAGEDDEDEEEDEEGEEDYDYEYNSDIDNPNTVIDHRGFGSLGTENMRIAHPEPAHLPTRGSATRTSSTSTTSSSLSSTLSSTPSSTPCLPSAAAAQSDSTRVDSTSIRSSRFVFSLGKLIILHLLTPVVSFGLIFVGLAAASTCFYSFCLGESLSSSDTAYLWRAWSRWICWPISFRHARASINVRVIPVQCSTSRL